MPNRIIKESICSSEDIDKLNPFAEVFFYRLIVKCDDFGRYDARPKVLKSALFPIKDGITAKNVEDALHTLASVGLVKLYEVDGRPFLFLPTWLKHQTKRAKESKWPDPISSENICKQMQADVPVFDIRNSSNGNESRENAPQPDTQDDLDVFTGELHKTVCDWFSYKTEKKQSYKPTGRKSLISEIQNNVKLHGEAKVIEVIRKSMGSNYQGIIWDRLNKENVFQKEGPPIQRNSHNRPVSPPGEAERAAMNRMMKCKGRESK